MHIKINKKNKRACEHRPSKQENSSKKVTYLKGNLPGGEERKKREGKKSHKKRIKMKGKINQSLYLTFLKN
jgi:hypothetical protein